MRFFPHAVTRFPESFNFLERNVFSLIARIGAMALHKREALLSLEAPPQVGAFLPGDVLLVGGHRRMTSLFIRGVVTHSLLYTGEGVFVHAIADGVEETHVESVLHEYDTYIVVRARTTQEQRGAIIAYAQDQVGKVYDFLLNPRKQEALFCTELIRNAFSHAGVDIAVASRWGIQHPEDFLKPPFMPIQWSNTLVRKGSSFLLGEQFPQWERAWKGRNIQ